MGVHEFLVEPDLEFSGKAERESAQHNEEIIKHKISPTSNLLEDVKPDLCHIAESKGPKIGVA